MKEKNENVLESLNGYENDYVPYIIKWGRITNISGALLSFLPCLLILFVFNIKAPISAVIKASVNQLSASFAYYFVDPIAFFPILGLAGTYMAFLTGNISNLRLPCAANALKSAGVDPGTKEATIISTLGIASSIFVNTLVLTIGIFIGDAIFKLITPAMNDALKFLVPAIFGAVFAQLSFDTPKIGAIAISIAVIMTFLLRLGAFNFLGEGPSYVVALATIFGSIFICKNLYEKGKLNI